MELARAKLVLIDEFLTDEAFGCSAVDERCHWCAFHGGVICEGDTQGVLLGEEHVIWE